MSCLLYTCILFLVVFLFRTGFGQETYYRFACDSPPTCHTNLYSIECAVSTKIAMKGVSYGVKPYTSYCSDAQSCVSKQRCCRYQTGDCLIPYSDEDLFEVYEKCSLREQCGWLFASSIALEKECQIRKRSNYIHAAFQCIADRQIVDVCSQHSITAESIYMHHPIIPPSYPYTQCTCVIAPAHCNTSATLNVRAADVRLHSRNNISMCDSESRVELVGQHKVKVFTCETGKFQHDTQNFYSSRETNLVLYLHKKNRVYPSNLLLEVQASIPGVKVKVTCGPRSVQTAKRCPVQPTSKPGVVDEVDGVPDKEKVTPNTITIDVADGPADSTDSDLNEPGEKHNSAMAAIIGGVAAGVVVLILLMLVVYFILRRNRNNKAKEPAPVGKPSLPYAEETHMVNYYETVSDPDNSYSPNTGRHIYHQPWGREPGVKIENRAKPNDLAYATSEEIKVLIEKMEKDRMFLNDGADEVFHQPDPTYYRHIDNYHYTPIDSDPDSQEENNEADSETESKSLRSEHCGTEKLESEDSKVEADRVIDSDVESSQRMDSYHDGYESPRVSSFLPSVSSLSTRDSVRTDSVRSEYQVEVPRFPNQTNNIIYEDSHSDIDVPSEHAPPVCHTEDDENESGFNTGEDNQSNLPSSSDNQSENMSVKRSSDGYTEIKDCSNDQSKDISVNQSHDGYAEIADCSNEQTKNNSVTRSESEDEITLGNYREPLGSVDISKVEDLKDGQSGAEEDHYTEVYDGVVTTESTMV